MHLLESYIGRHVLVHTGLVLVILLALFTFSMFVGELGDVGHGNYRMSDAARYVLMIMPRLAYQLFPTVALMGSIIGLGVLASNSELVVMRAAGVTMGQIVKTIMKIGFVLMLVAAFLGEWVAPIAEKYAQNMRASLIFNKVALDTEEGFWARDGENYLHIKEIRTDGSLRGVVIYQVGEERNLRMIVQANRGYYQDGAWVLRNITRSIFTADGVVTRQEKKATWDSLLSPELIDVVAVNPEFLSALGLYRYIVYLRENGLRSDRYEQAYWGKLASPLSTGVMVFLAIPFVFGPLRTVAVGQRILVGTLVGIGFYITNQIVAYGGLVNEVNPLVTVFAPPLAFLGLGIYLMRRVR
jgi:lipopolysaccharide export system permease protein